MTMAGQIVFMIGLSCKLKKKRNCVMKDKFLPYKLIGCYLSNVALVLLFFSKMRKTSCQDRKHIGILYNLIQFNTKM